MIAGIRAVMGAGLALALAVGGSASPAAAVDPPPSDRPWESPVFRPEEPFGPAAGPASERVTDPDAPEATITVTTAADETAANGTCSLREAIIAANLNVPYLGCVAGSGVTTDTIVFAPGVTQINLTAGLPAIADRVRIDGWLGAGGRARLNAAALGGTADVFFVATNDVWISNFQIFNGSPGGGALIFVQSGSGHAFYFNTLGVTEASAGCATGGVVRGGTYGIYFSSAVSNSAIYGNVIGCNQFAGILLVGADNNDIGVSTIGNTIGVVGSSPAPNGAGIYVAAAGANGARGNTIRSNLIAGNAGDGIHVIGNGAPNASSTSNTVIIGNRIGLQRAGNAALPNQGHGVNVTNGAFGNRVGGPADSDRNVISGNGGSGVNIAASNLTYVLGNYVGTNVTGTAAVGNGIDGVTIQGGLSNWIGCTLFCLSLNGNRIGGNNRSGVYVGGGDEHVVAANDIGQAPGGFFGIDIGNGDGGVDVAAGARRVQIGGTTRADMANTIAYNDRDGVSLTGASTLTNTIGQNLVFGNARHGVALSFGTAGNVITGTRLLLNGRAGIAADSDTSENLWSRISASANGGLGIDLAADAMASSVVNDPELTITSAKKVGPNIVIEGLAPPVLFAFGSRSVEVYEVSLDASGYGEGITYVGTTAIQPAGTFSLSVPGAAPRCYTAFITRTSVLYRSNSTEFSRSSCSLRLPIVTRN